MILLNQHMPIEVTGSVPEHLMHFRIVMYFALQGLVLFVWFTFALNCPES